MTARIHPAELASLPIILAQVAVTPAELAEPEAPPAIILLCASIGRTAADVAALMFALPIPTCLREVFEFQIRQAVMSELLTKAEVSDAVQQHAEDIAWITFDRRLERHAWSSVMEGRA